MTNKQSLIFTCSFVAIAFSLLSPNKYIWIISVPIALFIAISNAYIVTKALERKESR